MKTIMLSILAVLISATPAGASKASLIEKVSKIDVCEAKATGGWKSFSWKYPDGLGITRANWISFGGWVGGVSSVWTQVVIEMKFLSHYHMAMPDQHGCTGRY
jgi:hypothetical protein